MGSTTGSWLGSSVGSWEGDQREQGQESEVRTCFPSQPGLRGRLVSTDGHTVCAEVLITQLSSSDHVTAPFHLPSDRAMALH